MTNPRRRRKSTSNGRKSNPHRRRRRSNPEGIGSMKDLGTGAVSGLASAVATRQLPQLVLGPKNTGVMGYAANIITGMITTWLAAKFAGPRAAQGAAIGAGVIVLDRILSENVSPIGQYLKLSGTGDINAMHRMGTVRDGWYLHPTMVDGNNQMIVPDPVTQASVAAVLQAYPQLAQPMAQAMRQGGNMGAVNPSALRRHTASGQLLSSRFQSRFNQATN